MTLVVQGCCSLSLSLSGRRASTEATRSSGAPPSAVVLVVGGAVEIYVESAERHGSLAHVIQLE